MKKKKRDNAKILLTFRNSVGKEKKMASADRRVEKTQNVERERERDGWREELGFYM